jgi:choline dehydrogenase-like flavoprotein
MDRVVIVGSGASGVHFALSLLKKTGYDVLMVDTGASGAESVNSQDSFVDLKAELNDPAAYFLGEDFSGVFFPDIKSEYYGIPPNKSYVLKHVDGDGVKASGFAPLRSFAQGGLAQAWTGGVYPFHDHELEDFPFGYHDIEPYYNEVAKRIGISGTNDDLSRFMPVHQNLLSPLKLDAHSALLLSEYETQKDCLNHELRCYFGRARIATLTEERHGRQPCSYLGRCLWGCPSGAFYTPSITLSDCMRFSNFRYVPGSYVSHFRFNKKRQITSVLAKSLHGNTSQELPLDKLVLAAGTLSSSKIFLQSIFEATREIVTLHGLMDNRQVLIPFFNLKMIGRQFDPATYQYHQIAFGIEGEKPTEYLHGLITTLKTALVHPIIQKIPADLKTAMFVFRNLHAALGLVNLNFHDTRRDDNFVTLEVEDGKSVPVLRINYTPRSDERAVMQKALKKVKRALRKLKCIVPPGMIHVRPMGASVHYAGTIPMSRTNGAHTTSEYCQSRDFANLYFVDGTTFPFLPSKNITFTLMANAIRVADKVF